MKKLRALATSVMLTLGISQSELACAETIFKASLGHGQPEYTFRLAEEVEMLQNFWGRYSKPFSFTGGEFLYVFPDGRALLTNWCDICREKVLASGSYRFKNGKLNFIWEKRPSTFEAPAVLNAVYGQEEEQRPVGETTISVVTGSTSLLLDNHNMKVAQQPNGRFDYLRLDVEYYDWKRIYRDLTAVPAKKVK